MLQAYRAAQVRLAQEQPRCALTWPLLAGIGQVESGHGRAGGARTSAAGVVSPRIIGVPLDGSGPVARVLDSDDGRYDGDRDLDRAVGPMQFLPGTWTTYAADGDLDGAADPHDVDDAALAAGRYLCAAAGEPLTQPAAMVRAVFAYNHSTQYVRLVLTMAAGYAGTTPESLGTGLLPAPVVDVASAPSAAPVASPAPGAAPALPGPVAVMPVPAAQAPAAPGPAPAGPAGPVTGQQPTPAGSVDPATGPDPADAAPGSPSPEPAAPADQAPAATPGPGDAPPAPAGGGAAATEPPPAGSTQTPSP